jgi:hypothetical protein
LSKIVSTIKQNKLGCRIYIHPSIQITGNKITYIYIYIYIYIFELIYNCKISVFQSLIYNGRVKYVLEVRLFVHKTDNNLRKEKGTSSIQLLTRNWWWVEVWHQSKTCSHMPYVGHQEGKAVLASNSLNK